jgi:hypothetical protein
LTTRQPSRTVPATARILQRFRPVAGARLRALAAGLPGAVLLLGSLGTARAAVEPQAGPESRTTAGSTAALGLPPAFLRVETLPAGLIVFVNGDPVGRSPVVVGNLQGTAARVRALRDDQRRFDLQRDEAVVHLVPGDTALVEFDLRPPVAVETAPRGADLATRGPGAAGDSAIGSTPAVIPRSLFVGRSFLFHHPCCADTAVSGTALLELAGAGGTARVALRPISIPERSQGRGGRPFYRSRWLQWGMVLAGAGLTGASALLKKQGDRWYDRYLDSSDRSALPGYFDRAVHYDHLSLAALGVGQALFTGGLVLLVSHGAR